MAPNTCEHGRRKYRCKDCGGSSICVHSRLLADCIDCEGSNICTHKRIKRFCKDCNKAHICDHNKRRSRCKTCKGGSICKHNKERSRCTDCDGGSICIHKIEKSTCRQCRGTQICVHDKVKSRCKLCKGGSICIHNKQKSHCRECKGSAFCEHNKQRSACIQCGGNSICIHKKLKYYCKQCKGGSICKHNKNKRMCKDCGGSLLCKSEWCETTRSRKYAGYCLRCYIHLFPDKPVARNYKTKERAVVEHVLQQFPPEIYSWVTDKRVYDGCSKRRPDLFLDLGYQVIIVEVDENQHEQYDCSCENKRLMELSQDVNHRPLVFIRFNPDDYISTEGHITSCWAYNRLGVCAVKKIKQKEWSGRLESLCQQITYWLDENHKTDKTVEVLHLFYDTISCSSDSGGL